MARTFQWLQLSNGVVRETFLGRFQKYYLECVDVFGLKASHELACLMKRGASMNPGKCSCLKNDAFFYADGFTLVITLGELVFEITLQIA